jgi:RNA:NAD 2'-phosphotransferase (TPT1/KptA family)
MGIDFDQQIKSIVIIVHILRHKPEECGMALDESGCTKVNELINKLNIHK